MSETIAYTYLPEQNEIGAHLPGVPLRDLTRAEVEALPAWLQASVAACPFYRATKPPPQRKETTHDHSS